MRVFITGSTRAFGFELAKSFANKGYDIILNGRGKITFKTDWVYCECDHRQLSKEIFEECQPDIIINNAFDKADCLESLKGQVNVLQQAVEYFDMMNGGTIVNINSSKGLVADVDFPEYAAAKHGLRGYSESVKFEAYKRGVHILDLYPGAINVGMSAHREDLDKLMDAKELADFIVSMCQTKTFVVSTAHFNRKYLANDILK